MKRSILILFVFLCANIVMPQKSSLNVGFDLLGISEQTPIGAGFRLGYEFAIPNINFITLEARISGGKLVNEAQYQIVPVFKEWGWIANYFKAGICPRFYYKIDDDLKLFLDTEMGVALLSGKTYFSEQKKWNGTNAANYPYYSIRIGVAIPLTDRVSLSAATGYTSLDVTDMVNSRPSTLKFRFNKQAVDYDTTCTFHVIL